MKYLKSLKVAVALSNINNVQVASYEYDYKGRRVKKTVYGSPNVVTKYCYDGDQVIAEYYGSDTLLRKFIYGSGIDEPICMIDVTDSNAVYYYHFDGLGSVVALSKENREIVERYSYDVFGEPNRTSDVNNPYLFAGRRYDSEISLYYYRARYYSAYIGRFLQTDPIGYTAGLNLYTYVGNNPLNWADPYGLDCLGIHTDSGHAWLTYTTENGVRTDYGLYNIDYVPKNNTGDVQRLRPDSDIWMFTEDAIRQAYNSRYQDLTPAQPEKFTEFLQEDHDYIWPDWFLPTNNCSSFASDGWLFVTGEDLNADTWYIFGLETPGTLSDSIENANLVDYFVDRMSPVD